MKPNLVVGGINDPLEHEADRMAAETLGLPGVEPPVTGSDPVQGRIQPTAEAEIAAVLREPGRPLNPHMGAVFGHRYGFDFAEVRIHEGGQAARAARAVGADAYSLGAHLVFAEGGYDHSTVRGQALLAHELAHVVQSARTGVPPVIRRSLAGTLTGAGIGAAIGGVALGLLGSLLGPAGAVVGGVVGALAGGIVGGLIGDKASSQSRKLTSPEKDAAKAIFRASVNLDVVELRRGSLLSGGDTARTSGNIINLPDGYFVGNTLNLTPEGSLTLIHELGHVWQYQHGGFSYVRSSLEPQAAAESRGLSRNIAYNWRDSADSGVPWERWNAEEQAQCISDYNEAARRIEADQYETDPQHDRLKDFDTVSRAEPYILKVQAGVGAPGSTPAPAGR